MEEEDRETQVTGNRPLKTGKSKETDCPLEPAKRNIALLTLDFSLMKPM